MSQPIVVVDKYSMIQKLITLGLEAVHPMGYVPVSAYHRAEIDKFLTENMEIKERSQMEKDPTYWQLIPYGVIVDDFSNIVGYRRPDKQRGEERLRGARSVGFGGHVDAADTRDIATGDKLTAAVIMSNCLYRELQEELNTGDTQLLPSPQFTGLLIDNSNAVGEVHLGFVYRVIGIPDVFLPNNADEVSELTLLEPIRTPRQEFENWSKLVLDNIDTILAN